MRHDLVACDPESPREPLLFSVEVSDARTNAIEDLLRDVFGVGTTANASLSEGQNDGPQLIKEHVERSPIAIGEPNHGVVDGLPTNSVHASNPEPKRSGTLR